jgi:hypothetical protein
MILKLNGMKKTLEVIMNNYIYKLWFWIGCKCRLFRTYNIERDKNMKDVRQRLEHAFTPEVKQLLEDKIDMG